MQKHRRLATLVEEQSQEIIERWSQRVHEILGLTIDEQPQLIDHLPEFLEELGVQLLEPTRDMRLLIQFSRLHGRHRKQAGIDIRGLVCEFGMIQEVIQALAHEHALTHSWRDIQLLNKMMWNAAADSVDEYAKLKDQELAEQASAHFAFVAHEIRNPLQTANMAMQLLSKQLDEKDPAALRLARSLRQLRDLVDNSLVNATLGGTVRPHFTRLQVAHIVEEACTDVGLNAEKKSVSIDLQLEEGLDVDGDARLLYSIMTNLLSNALKFTRDSGVITVRVSTVEEERVRIEVEDECGGLQVDEPGKLFTPFVQAQNDWRGFGLGLSIVKQAAEAHHGCVRIHDLPGKGCIFMVELPRFHLYEQEQDRAEDGAQGPQR